MCGVSFYLVFLIVKPQNSMELICLTLTTEMTNTCTANAELQQHKVSQNPKPAVMTAAPERRFML